MYTFINTKINVICAKELIFKNDICICINIQQHQQTNDIAPFHIHYQEMHVYLSKKKIHKRK